MAELPMLKGRTTCPNTLYEAPSYETPKIAELGKDAVFQFISVQQENHVNWCKVQASDGKQGYLVGFLVEILRDCSIAHDGVPVYDAGKSQVANLAQGTPVRAWLPPDPNLQLPELEDRKAWIEVERDNGSAYVCGTHNLKVPRLPSPSSRSGEPVSFVKALPGLAMLLGIAGVGFFVLSKVIGMILTSRSAYTISALILGTWLALKTFRRR